MKLLYLLTSSFCPPFIFKVPIPVVFLFFSFCVCYVNGLLHNKKNILYQFFRKPVGISCIDNISVSTLYMVKQRD